MPTTSLQNHAQPLAVAPQEAASLLGSTESSLEKDRAIGHLGIPYVKAGRRVIYQMADLKQWLSSNRVVPLKANEKKE
jgi:hypothetical protein